MRAALLSLLFATASAASAEPWLTGATPLGDVWDGEGVRVTFVHVPYSGVLARESGTLFADVEVDCGTTRVEVERLEQGGEARVRLLPLESGEAFPGCSEEEREAHEGLLGSSLFGRAGGDTLRLPDGGELRRKGPTERIRELHAAMTAAKLWLPTPDTAERFGDRYASGQVVSVTFDHSRVGGRDGCNGWGADYRLLPSRDGGAVLVTDGMASTTAFCGHTSPYPYGGAVALRPDGNLEFGAGLVFEPGTAEVAEVRAKEWAGRNFADAVTLKPYKSWVFQRSSRAGDEGERMRERARIDVLAVADDVVMLAGHDGCNGFRGRARFVFRDSWGLELLEPMRRSEMSCEGNNAAIMDALFAYDSIVGAWGDELNVVHGEGGTTVFHRLGRMRPAAADDLAGAWQVPGGWEVMTVEDGTLRYASGEASDARWEMDFGDALKGRPVAVPDFAERPLEGEPALLGTLRGERWVAERDGRFLRLRSSTGAAVLEPHPARDWELPDGELWKLERFPLDGSVLYMDTQVDPDDLARAVNSAWLAFDGYTVVGSAGCNGGSAPFGQGGGAFPSLNVLASLPNTQRACADGGVGDALIRFFLQGGPAFVRDGDTLTLRYGDADVVFRRAALPE